MSDYGTLRSARSSLCGRVFRFTKYNEGFPTPQKKGTLFWYSAHPGCKFVRCNDMWINVNICEYMWCKADIGWLWLLYVLRCFQCVLRCFKQSFWNECQLMSAQLFREIYEISCHNEPHLPGVSWLSFTDIYSLCFFRRRGNPGFDDGGISNLFNAFQIFSDLFRIL